LSKGDHLNGFYVTAMSASLIDNFGFVKWNTSTEKRYSSGATLIITLRCDETDILAIWFVGSTESQLNRSFSHFRLGHRSHRKQSARQTLLIQHMNHVTLIFGTIYTANQVPNIVALFNTCVMSGGYGIKSKQQGPLIEPIKLHMPIAFDTRIRGNSPSVVVDIRVNNRTMKVIAEIKNQVINPQLLSNSSGIIDIADAAASGIALTTPEAHRHSDNLMTLVAQNSCSNRGVNSPGHGDENFHNA
jgi:hypothetical protein